jgi:site-specific DNA recombinase
LGRKWQLTPIRQILRGRSLLGQLHYDGQAVRDDDGLPVQLADPLVTVDEWERVQAVLDGNANARKDARRAPTALLSGLAFCGTCGKVLHSESNTSRKNSTGERRTYRYYSCADRCSPMLPAGELDEVAEEEFLRYLGDREVRERVWVPGDSNQEALAEAVRAVDELSAAAGRAASATMRQRLQRQLDALDARIAELEAQPAREAHWEWQSTGGTYGDVWEAAAGEPEPRRALLQRSGITFAARNLGGKAREFRINIPEGVYREPGLADQQRAIGEALADPNVAGVNVLPDGSIAIGVGPPG